MVVLIMGISVYGITKINVNDNPVKWFAADHEIRIADRVLNSHFGGTYTAYLTLSAPRPESCTCLDVAEAMDSEANKRFRKYLPEATDQFLGELELLKQLYCNVNSSNEKKCFVELVNRASFPSASEKENHGRIGLILLPVRRIIKIHGKGDRIDLFVDDLLDAGIGSLGMGSQGEDREQAK